MDFFRLSKIRRPDKAIQEIIMQGIVIKKN